MNIEKYFQRISENKYFTTTALYANYIDEKDLIVFIIDVENILEVIYSRGSIGIRYRNQKALLKVLKFILTHYKLYLIKSPVIGGKYYENKYHSKYVGAREVLVSILIYELSKNLGYEADTYKCLCIDFIKSYKNNFQKNKSYDDYWQEEVVPHYMGGDVCLAYSYQYYLQET